MEPVSRRSFLTKGAVGAAGVVGATSLGLSFAGKAGAAEPPLSEEEIALAALPILVHIRNAKTGEIEVLVEEQSIVFTDKSLVAKVLRATR